MNDEGNEDYIDKLTEEFVKATKEDSEFFYSYRIIAEVFMKDKPDVSAKIFSIDNYTKKISVENLFPYVSISGKMLKRDIYDYLYKNQENILCRVIVYIFKYDRNFESIMSTDQNKNAPILYEEIYNDVYVPIPDESCFTFIKKPGPGGKTFDPSVYQDDRRGDSEYNEIAEKGTNVQNSFDVRLYLFNYNGQKLRKQIINQVFSEAKLGTVINYLINEYDEIKYAIVDSPDNETKYKEIIIPPIRFKNSIKFLQYLYGIYKTGVRINYDNDTLYILDTYRQIHEYKQKDSPMFMLTILEKKENAPSVDLTTVREFDAKGFTINSYKTMVNVNFYTNKFIDGDAFGDKMIYTNYSLFKNSILFKDGKLNTFEKPYIETKRGVVGSHKMTGDYTLLEYDELNNPFNVSKFMVDMNSAFTKTEISINNVDARDFAPNKTVYLNFTNKELQAEKSGFYFMSNFSISFIPIQTAKKMSGDYFIAMAAVNLNKTV